MTVVSVTVRMGRALRAIRREAGLSQTELAGAVEVGQETVSAWERGRGIPLEAVPALERACRAPAGALLRMAGLCGSNGNGRGARDALEHDPELDEATRATVLAAYDGARRAVRATRARARRGQ